MKNKLFFAIIIIGCTNAVNSVAQQLSYNNQYQVNKYSLSPAYTGYNYNLETFMTFRQAWSGLAGAPQIKMINANGRLMSNMGLGCSVISEQAGIFNGLSANLSYAYHLKINEMQSASFGLSAGIYDNYIDPSISKSEAGSDPVALLNQGIGSTEIEATFGALYRFQNLNAGIVVPRLLEPATTNDSDYTVYTLKRHYYFHLSYAYPINKMFSVEPFLVTRYAQNVPLFYELTVVGRYKGQYWLGLSYRKGSSIGVSLGILPHDRIAFNYSFEFSSSGIAGISSGTHELTLGFLIGENKNKMPSVFGTGVISSKKPYYNFMEQ
ncbi:MAG: PorP/SprF family type IX secretion system membrane protein [Bacteroidetes bacterium]|nr:PorP/SprF family type IX secretion system membrane protein [Bacteroidota bacterium]